MNCRNCGKEYGNVFKLDKLADNTGESTCCSKACLRQLIGKMQRTAKGRIEELIKRRPELKDRYTKAQPLPVQKKVDENAKYDPRFTFDDFEREDV